MAARAKADYRSVRSFGAERVLYGPPYRHGGTPKQQRPP